MRNKLLRNNWCCWMVILVGACATNKAVTTATPSDTLPKASGTMRVRRADYNLENKVVKPIPVPTKQRLD